MFNLNLKSAFFAVLATLVVSGVLFNPNSAHATEVPAKVGDTVTVTDGDTVVVDVPKAKTAVVVKAATVVDPAITPKAEVAAPVVAAIMADNFSEPKAAAEEIDQDSVVELAVRGALSPTGPAVGGTLGFSYRPANRVRLYVGFNASKGILDLKGQEKELVQFGFTAGVSRVVTRTVEAGLFGTMSWSYRDLVKETSTSFIGIGPGFRLNKAAGLVFFEAGIPIGFSKKFADGSWELNKAIQIGAGVHF